MALSPSHRTFQCWVSVSVVIVLILSYQTRCDLLPFMHHIHCFQTKNKAKSIVFQARYRTTTTWQQVKYNTEQYPSPGLLISLGYVDLRKKSDFQGQWVWHMQGSPSWSSRWKKEEGHICRPDPWERSHCQHVTRSSPTHLFPPKL